MIALISTLEKLVAGDITAGGTLARLDIRGPRVMNKFWQSPILGWGFANGYYEYADGHVGHQNILLNVGIVGYLFVNGLFIYLCIKIWSLCRKVEAEGLLKRAPLVYIGALIAVYVIHTSSTQFWGFDMYYDQIKKVLFFSLLFTAVNICLSKYRHRLSIISKINHPKFKVVHNQV